MNTDTRSTLAAMLGMLQKGQMTEGQQKYFAEGVVTQEGNDAPVIGKQAAIDRLAKFRESLGIVGFISYEVGSVAVVGDVSFYDAVLNVKISSGDTISLEQVVRSEWKDGKVTKERYYHG